MSRIVALLTLFIAGLAVPVSVQAQCPVCTVAVAAGVGMSRYLGIDDTVSGVWMGALTFITALWVVKWLESKKIWFWFRRPIIIIAMFVLTIWPLQSIGMIGNPLNTLWGIDRLLLGMLAGAVAFIVASFIDTLARITNHDKVLVPFQKVIFPVTILALTSGIFYVLTR